MQRRPLIYVYIPYELSQLQGAIRLQEEKPFFVECFKKSVEMAKSQEWYLWAMWP